MIIVSQKKNSITNFDNVTNIEIDKFEDDGFLIKCQITNKMYVNVGFYKTEKRAKEVLQEIITGYTDFNYLKSFPTNITKSVEQFMHKKYSYFNVYEMPEE